MDPDATATAVAALSPSSIEASLSLQRLQTMHRRHGLHHGLGPSVAKSVSLQAATVRAGGGRRPRTPRSSGGDGRGGWRQSLGLRAPQNYNEKVWCEGRVVMKILHAVKVIKQKKKKISRT
jgi:hypothetical protein